MRYIREQKFGRTDALDSPGEMVRGTPNGGRRWVLKRVLKNNLIFRVKLDPTVTSSANPHPTFYWTAILSFLKRVQY